MTELPCRLCRADGVLCTRCWHTGHDCHLRISLDGCYTGTQGELISLLESPRLSRSYRMRVAQMLREGLGLCLEPHCSMNRYAWGPDSGYCPTHEPIRVPESARYRAENSPPARSLIEC